jgi:hypothetical protein
MYLADEILWPVPKRRFHEPHTPTAPFGSHGRERRREPAAHAIRPGVARWGARKTQNRAAAKPECLLSLVSGWARRHPPPKKSTHELLKSARKRALVAKSAKTIAQYSALGANKKQKKGAGRQDKARSTGPLN